MQGQHVSFVFRLSCSHVWDGLKETRAGVLKGQAGGREGTQGRKKHRGPEGLADGTEEGAQ